MQLSWDTIRTEIIGNTATILTSYGERYVTYADYTASGRGISFIEHYLRHVLELYANTHTEDDSTGRLTSRRLEAAEQLIKRRLNADDNYHLITVGAGATAAINRLQQILGIYIPPATRERFGEAIGTPAVVFVGPYEHHSNEISWREGIAEVIEVDLDADGTVSLADLSKKLEDPQWKGHRKIGSFSAASNVTGIVTDVYAVARLLHAHGALAFFDYSAAAPYVTIDVHRDEESYFDGLFFSPHKYLGGPGSSGILVIHDSVYRHDLSPSVAGGGTVRFVSNESQDYLENVEMREKAGTPGILQTMRAALAMDLQYLLGVDRIAEREVALLHRAYSRFADEERVVPLVPLEGPERLAIFSFNIVIRERFLHPRFVVRLMNDLFGIQARAGCSCAGPYGHRLLNIGPSASSEHRRKILEGEEGFKPGWVRLNFHYLLTDDEFDFICEAVEFVAQYGMYFLGEYHFDPKSGAWRHRDDVFEVEGFGVGEALLHLGMNDDESADSPVDMSNGQKLDTLVVRRKYLDQALERAYQLTATFDESRIRQDGVDLLSFWYMEQEQ